MVQVKGFLQVDGLPELKIGEVARRAGIETSAIRYYERIGLLPEPDRLGGQRRYDPEVLGKLGFIGVAQSADFKLREIRELIDGVDGVSGMGEQMRSLSSRKLDEVEALLERTKAMMVGWRRPRNVAARPPPSARCFLRPARSLRAPSGRCGWSGSRARTVVDLPRADLPMTLPLPGWERLAG